MLRIQKQKQYPDEASHFIRDWLENREHILNSLLHNLDGMAYCCLLDTRWTMLYISEGCLALTGYQPEDLLQHGLISYEEITFADDRQHVRDSILDAISLNQSFDIEYRIINSVGEVRWVSERGKGISNHNGDVEAVEGFIQDITVRKQSEQAILEAEKRYRSIFENTVEGIFQTTEGGRYLSANPALARLYGYSTPNELISNLNDIENQLYVDRNKRKEFSELMKLRGRVTNFESQVYRRDGSVIWISENARSVKDSHGNLLYYEGTVEDITERKENSAIIEYQATHDDLTGLPNRTLLKDRLHQAILNAERSQSQLAVVFVDLDQFKDINDSMGHHVGDQLLISMAERLSSCIRDSDTVARPGGDEFVLLLPDLHGVETLSHTLQRILSTVSQPCYIEPREFVVTCSLGISMYPQDGHDIDTLLKHADNAMYKAKQAGKNNFQFYTRELNAMLLERLELEYHLRHAIKNNEFELYFQPKMSIHSGKITGLEALLRWHSSIQGMISPKIFIPIAEESVLIEQIGEWVLEEACRQSVYLHQQTGRILPIAINISPRQFYRPDLPEIIEKVISRSKLNPFLIELEITEGTIVRQPSKFIDILKRLKSLGIKLAIDDFGTGYSSMSYLKNFPIDHLKIDQSFVKNLEDDITNQAILRAIVALGKNLGLEVIAEGVETESQRSFLAAIGCDQMQGYLLGKPMNMQDLLEFIRDRT
ncbi:MAG: GGDEF domain-containing protein [Betaproteobacteria bacterium HGW-Betaproteobacteria-2]|nr:MAG: GGDEF domain-containing protein [Betaproteobacteria bacterium HGW-Betaproteobacteria-2]